MVYRYTGVLDGIQCVAALAAGSVIKGGGDQLTGGRFRKGTKLDPAQRRDDNLSTKSPKELSSLLQEHGICAPISATKPQLLKIISSVPCHSKSSIITPEQLTLAFIIILVVMTWTLLSDWRYISNIYVLEKLSYLGVIFSSLRSLVDFISFVVAIVAIVILLLVWRLLSGFQLHSVTQYFKHSGLEANCITIAAFAYGE